MKENRINAITAIVFCIAALIMLGALSFAIGKWSWGRSGYQVTIKFPNASGIAANSEVKCAGAHAGRVREVHFIPRDQRDKDPKTGMVNTIMVVCDIDKDIDVGKDVEVTIKQDGFGISAKYVLLTPGTDPNSPALADNDTVQGEPPFDLSDLIQPAGEALEQAKTLVNKLGPVMDRLDTLSQKMSTSLPPLMDHADKFLQDGDSVLANFDTPAGRKRLNDMLDSLRVSTENLKVVSTNAKALTATLAEKPWRVFWGGSTVKPPSEDEILDSNQVIRLKPDVDVNAPAPANK
ncbi:MAG TPA: MlaD family protein [Candidatus Methylacidiphilales bacterium]|jgi:ABC-type transporter Mla subunit MlaD|nr:MlaD family protein [Candidatus Methylacidiphilales bacterium]